MKRLREQALKPLFWTGRCVFLGMWVDDGDVKYSSQVITMMSLSTQSNRASITPAYKSEWVCFDVASLWSLFYFVRGLLIKLCQEQLRKYKIKRATYWLRQKLEIMKQFMHYSPSDSEILLLSVLLMVDVCLSIWAKFYVHIWSNGSINV